MMLYKRLSIVSRPRCDWKGGREAQMDDIIYHDLCVIAGGVGWKASEKTYLLLASMP